MKVSKKILITGKNSYVGKSFIKWMSEKYSSTVCDEISVRGIDWKNYDFSTYDSVLHVAGIAHVNSKKFKDEDYYNVNTDLTIQVAKKAKEDGVKQFIFMSSIIVYSDSEIKGGIITEDSVPKSLSAYGNSKIQAEKGIMQLDDDSFKIVIVRPPMIYGPGSKGNYRRLSKLAKVTPFFPDFNNQRSMIYISNLNSFLKNAISNQFRGVFFPDNSDYVCTSQLVYEIGKAHNKKVRMTKIFNPLINIFINTTTVKKMFGNLYYSVDMLEHRDTINEVDFISSVRETEINNGI